MHATLVLEQYSPRVKIQATGMATVSGAHSVCKINIIKIGHMTEMLLHVSLALIGDMLNDVLL